MSSPGRTHHGAANSSGTPKTVEEFGDPSDPRTVRRRLSVGVNGELFEKALRGTRDLGDRGLEGLRIALRGVAVAAHLANELKRGGLDLLGGRRRVCTT